MNKKEITEYCKKLLKNQAGYILNDIEYGIIRMLLDNHTEAKQKIGVGVQSIFVGKGLYGSHCFWIKRKDGTETEFSYRSCLNPPTQVSQFKKACREAAQKDIDAYLDSKGDGVHFTCELSGAELIRKDCHVNHFGEYKFSDIVNMFIKEYEISVDSVKFNETMNGCMHTIFEDKELGVKFYEFHKKYARLRVIDKNIHKDLTNRKNNGNSNP